MKYIAREGLIFIFISAVFSLIFFLLYLLFAGSILRYWMLSLFAVSLALFIFNIYFFRDPERKSLASQDEVICPADGRVIFFGKVFDDRFLNDDAVKISIFMSLFNVHVNRVPLSGFVEKIIYNKGKFFSANLDKASIENEYNGVILKSGYNNQKIAFVQIAGLIARRIVCRIKEGDEIHAGDRYGLIRYGSRLDIYLPVNFNGYIKTGEKVFSGKTVLGKLFYGQV